MDHLHQEDTTRWTTSKKCWWRSQTARWRCMDHVIATCLFCSVFCRPPRHTHTHWSSTFSLSQTALLLMNCSPSMFSRTKTTHGGRAILFSLRSSSSPPQAHSRKFNLQIHQALPFLLHGRIEMHERSALPFLARRALGVRGRPRTWRNSTKGCSPALSQREPSAVRVPAGRAKRDLQAAGPRTADGSTDSNAIGGRDLQVATLLCERRRGLWIVVVVVSYKWAGEVEEVCSQGAVSLL